MRHFNNHLSFTKFVWINGAPGENESHKLASSLLSISLIYSSYWQNLPFVDSQLFSGWSGLSLFNFSYLKWTGSFDASWPLVSDYHWLTPQMFFWFWHETRFKFKFINNSRCGYNEMVNELVSQDQLQPYGKF